MDPNLRAKLIRLAAGQHGNITRRQLLALGLGAEAIKHGLRTGHLHRVHIGVYAVGLPPQTFLERASAALLACGPGAALSHYSALYLWGLANHEPTLFDVVVPGDRRRPGIRVHQPKGLTARDLDIHRNLRVTSPARTLLDCAPLLPANAVTRAVNDAQIRKLLKNHHLAELLTRNPRHPGTKILRPLTADDTGPTRSEFEDLFNDFCRRYELPRPILNATVAGYEVDALFPEHKLIVELDGWSFHRSRASFERDRSRDANTLAAGFSTVRITWERLTRAPRHEADRLQKILAARG